VSTSTSQRSTPPVARTSTGPTRVDTTVVELKTHDGARVSGLLRTPHGTRPKTAVSLMHPRQEVTHHRLVPYLLGAGYAVWTQGSRSVNNDIALLHEQTLLDVGAGQVHLRDEGFEHLVTLGHSGGGTLYAFYQEQARRAADDRLTNTPSGRPVDLPGADLPAPDGAAFIAPHPGQGVLLERLIDPSVTDEANPVSVDPSLDPYAPENGFAPPPEPASYDIGFVDRYRAAQRARVRRLDDQAREHLAAARVVHERHGEDPDPQQLRRSLTTAVMTIYRTDADLRSVDLGLDPNERPYGSLYGRRPDLANYGLAGFARVTTPEAWLSTWSANSSRANFMRNAPSVTSPVLLVELTGDQACFPADARAMLEAFGSEDTSHVRVPGLHFGQPLHRGEPSGIELAWRHIGPWLEERFAPR
jgi:hypothetical protein